MDVVASAALLILPAVFSHERHKPHRCNLGLLELVAPSREHVERLFFPVAQRNKDTTSLCQLLVVCRRDFRRPSPNEYRIVRCVLSPPKGAISQKKRDVARSDLPDGLARVVEEGWNALYRKNLARELRQQRGLIARACTDLQHFLIPRELENLEIPGVN